MDSEKALPFDYPTPELSPSGYARGPKGSRLEAPLEQADGLPSEGRLCHRPPPGASWEGRGRQPALGRASGCLKEPQPETRRDLGPGQGPIRQAWSGVSGWAAAGPLSPGHTPRPGCPGGRRRGGGGRAPATGAPQGPRAAPGQAVSGLGRACVSQPLHNARKVAGRREDLRGRAALPGRRAPGAQPQLRSPRRDAAPASGDRALQRLRGSSRPPPISRSPGSHVLPVARCAPLCSFSYRVPRQKLPLCPSPRRIGLRSDRHPPPPPQALVRVQRQMSRWLTCQAATVRSRSVDHVRGLLSLKPQT